MTALSRVLGKALAFQDLCMRSRDWESRTTKPAAHGCAQVDRCLTYMARMHCVFHHQEPPGSRVRNCV